MSARPDPVESIIEKQQQIVADLLVEAKRQGATAAEAAVMTDRGRSITVRMGELETVEHTGDRSLGVTLYFGQRKGVANTTDLSPKAIKETVHAARQIAEFTSEDPYAGLAPKERLATTWADLDLHHPWEIDAEAATRLALECEQAGRDVDVRIVNSEGANLHTQAGSFVYGNSNGFVGGYASSRHNLSVALIAKQGDEMERDYWYDTSRSPEALKSASEIGQAAAKRTVERLGARKIKTEQVPVLYRAQTANSLLRGFIGALRGPNLYRQASFLLDQMGQPLFPSWTRIHENPLLPQGMSSSPFDHEGVALAARDLITDGVLQGYVLDSYSARRLGMETTGNSGGVRNLRIESTGQSFADLVKQMGRGLIVTELMGHGTNLVTGDYSQGAAGFWVENGEIQYPVSEVTVAGNLKAMFAGLQAVGTDYEAPGSYQTGSWLINQMTVAGE